jgi:tetratricopeptide (TPR) repeat protein
MKERQSSSYDGALDILNKVIALKPDYPEAWNQRATIYFFKYEYEKSLEDVAKTLELEPRRFGALRGRGNDST